MNAALACPWCGAVLSAEPTDACPQCGATLVERRAANASDPIGEPIVPVDPMLADLAPTAGERLTTSPASDSTSRSASAKAVLGQVVDADPVLNQAMASSPFSADERDLGFEPPSDAVRLEMHRMKVEAMRHQLEAEATEYQYVVDAPAGATADEPSDESDAETEVVEAPEAAAGEAGESGAAESAGPAPAADESESR